MLFDLTPELSAGDWINLVLAAAAVLALIVATAQLRLVIISLRRSSQPVVVAHLVSSGLAARSEAMDYHVFLENLGVGAAFNVRFGVEVGGTRYPFALPGSVRGARQLVPAGARVPPTGELRVQASWAAWGVYGEEGGEGRPPYALWARYENAFGETWQTTNPADPEEDFEVPRRLRRRELHRLEVEEAQRRRTVEARAGTRLVAELEEVRARGEREASGDNDGH